MFLVQRVCEMGFVYRECVIWVLCTVCEKSFVCAESVFDEICVQRVCDERVNL